MREVLETNMPQIRKSAILNNLELKKANYFVVSCHREENVDSNTNIAKFSETLFAIAERYQLPIIVSTHPRTAARIEKLQLKLPDEVMLMKPMGFFDYNHLQLHAKCTLSDSGTISEESSILNFPALNIREAHERPEAMEEGSVMMVGLNKHRVLQGLDILTRQGRGNDRTLQPVFDYQSSNISEKVVRILHSYTDYVNRVVWQK